MCIEYSIYRWSHLWSANKIHTVCVRECAFMCMCLPVVTCVLIHMQVTKQHKISHGLPHLRHACHSHICQSVLSILQHGHTWRQTGHPSSHPAGGSVQNSVLVSSKSVCIRGHKVENVCMCVETYITIKETYQVNVIFANEAHSTKTFTTVIYIHTLRMIQYA